MSKSESEIKKLESAELAVKSIRNHQIGFTEQKINVFPNPVYDKVNIEFGANKVSVEDITIMDVLGKQCPVTVTNVSLNNGVELDFSSFPKGMYLIKINTEDSEKIFNIIKE